MRIGVYVGSFNPVHKGHKHVMDFLIKEKIVDKIIVIATGNYWDKTDLINVADRINMLKFYESKTIIVDNKLNNIEYTYQILDKLNNQDDELYLIIGSDNLPSFNLWKNVDDILKHKIIVLKRDNTDAYKYINNFKQSQNFIYLDKFKSINISSTTIRNSINKGLKNKYIDDEIMQYIANKGLYK